VVQSKQTSLAQAFRILLPLLLALSAAAPLRAEPNRYDVLSRVLMPFVSVFAEKSKSPHRAFSLAARLEQMTGLPAELAGARVELSLEAPDKLRLRAPVLGETLTIRRRGQEIWASPGAKLQAMLDATESARRLPPPDPKAALAPFRLPIPEKQLVFLPALFQVRDAGEQSLDGDLCRVLDLELMPQLAKSLDAGGWTARLWVRPDMTPARLLVLREGWRLAVRFDRVEFARSLPPETWQPEEGEDALPVSATRYDQLLRAALGEKR
jgi:hypothetical protein